MANFAFDPLPHVPRGFEVVPRNPASPPSRMYAYIGGILDAYNEDLAIAFLLPAAERSLGFIGPLLPVQPLVPYDMSDDEEVMEISAKPSSITPRKRRHHKMKEPLDASFLRRSKRLSKDHGFRTDEQAAEASNNPSIYEAHAVSSAIVAPTSPLMLFRAWRQGT
nr:unnamed protein product [Digitaria exilis]